MNCLKYRSDIDGLRAAAVLGVVIYHAFPWVIPGGFTGVDIFFVISGYLISGILYKGHNAGNFSPSSFFLEFYSRRIRRLFPALITMLVITLAYGWMILLPDEFRQLGKHVAAGTLFIQNIVFWQESGYFDTAANLKPLLHLWSLAVEEQFYIFFPLLLILLWKKPKIVAPVMGVMLIGTFILNVVMSVQNGVSDFFLTPYRAWEFLGGSLLACWHYDKGLEEQVPMYREAFSWIGAMLLILGMAFIHTGDPYPVWRALLPVAGTLLLMEGGRSAWVNRKILSNPGVVWIGLISYPLYLFHWPALSFVHIVKGESPKACYLFGALGVALLLTLVTYYFIERKIRNNKAGFVTIGLILTFIITGFSGAIICNRKVLVNNEIEKIENARNDWIGEKCLTENWKKGGIICSSYGHGDVKTVFVGDSNMQQYAPRIKELIDGVVNSHSIIMLSYAGAPPIAGVTNYNHMQSKEMIYELEKIISQNKTIKQVVIGCLWTWYFRENTNFIFNDMNLSSEKGMNRALQELGSSIKYLKGNGIDVYMIMNIPIGDELDPKNFYKRDFSGTIKTNVKKLTVKEFKRWSDSIGDKIKSISTQNGANIIDPITDLSSNGICISEYERGPVHFDYTHLRADYVRNNIRYLDNIILKK